jgi:hypothetical protein
VSADASPPSCPRTGPQLQWAARDGGRHSAAVGASGALPYASTGASRQSRRVSRERKCVPPPTPQFTHIQACRCCSSAPTCLTRSQLATSSSCQTMLFSSRSRSCLQAWVAAVEAELPRSLPGLHRHTPTLSCGMGYKFFNDHCPCWLSMLSVELCCARFFSSCLQQSRFFHLSRTHKQPSLPSFIQRVTLGMCSMHRRPHAAVVCAHALQRVVNEQC